MGLDRRTFLQKAGLGLAGLGMSETVLSLLGDQSLAVPMLDRYFQVLAQPGARKLALLVGINQYPRIAALGGCITDVELQRELLIHRFGVNPSDILVLTDNQATRENIETTFVEHLTKQAKAGDVVLFHFSGYGSRVKVNQESQTDQSILLQNSLVPADGIVPTKGTPIGNDLLEETLILLMRSLATDHITAVLDTSYTRAVNILQGNLRVRSCPNPAAERPSSGELAFQEQILRNLKDQGRQVSPSESLTQVPGLVLAAAGPSQLATEAQWNGFSAGLFTYALTQHLWQASPATTIRVSLSRTAGTVNQLAGKEQQPRLSGKTSQQKPLLAYYLPPDPNIGADGVVTAIEDNGKAAQIWLAGLPATVLEYYGTNSLLQLVGSLGGDLSSSGQNKLKASDSQVEKSDHLPSAEQALTPDQPIRLQVRFKEGLIAKARIVGTNVAENYQLQVGQLVQEVIRVLPRNLGLTIALDSLLERIERVDATSAFASIPSVSSVVGAGEQPADYLFGKISKTPMIKVASPAVTGSEMSEGLTNNAGAHTGGYGLFYLARDPIPNTAGEAGEAVKSAASRLTPKLKTLRAAKLLRLTANEGSSRLGIRASLERVETQPQTLMQRETLRVSKLPNFLKNKRIEGDLVLSAAESSIPKLPIGSRIQYRLENYSDYPVYFIFLGVDTNTNAIALYKIRETSNMPLQDAVIQPGESLTIPQPAASFNWVVPGPAGLVELQLICSRAPFKKAITTLEAAGRPKGEGERIDDLFNPLEVAQGVLQDLHNASNVSADIIGTVSDSYVLDVNAWATLNFIYQVV
ncbi:caspase family protein [Lyngbya aestuarii]|uniref:caspase family protein n=1 Tax=Lyngbya aestuarii TaxID=118322 RepID=UPI00403D946E